MRPVVVISANTAWNIANFREGLLRALLAAGLDVVVLAPPDAHVPKIVALGCRFIPLPMDNRGTSPTADLLLLWRFWRILGRVRPVAYLGYTIKPNVYGSLAAQALGIPTINNIAGLGTAFIRQSWLTTMAKLLYRVALARAGRVFFQNQDDRKRFVGDGIVDLGQTELLPGSGIDLNKFLPLARSRADGEIRFLLIARLLWDKGIGEFVEAARVVRRQRPEARFQLLGFLDVPNRTAIDRATLEGWVKEGVVDYLGQTDDVRPFIADADCVVLPSYREGVSRTLLEAAAAGRPLIATDVPGCREVVEEGSNGFLCRARDAEDLARTLLRFCALDAGSRAAMGRASRGKAEREFDEAIVIDHYLEALAPILARRGKALSTRLPLLAGR